MRTPAPKCDPGAKGPGMLHEADVGSGERSPGQHETDQMIREIPPRGGQQEADQSSSHRSEKGGAAKP